MSNYILIILGAVLLIKNFNTYLNGKKIINAIYEYHMVCCDKDVDPVVDYGMMKNYFISLLRIWDWSYEHILPTDKLEVIKPYIGLNKEVEPND